MSSSQQSPVHVAVAVIPDSRGRVLVSKRHVDSHQGGYWEFPGGKVESGESVLDALKREIREELGLVIKQAFPLKKISHHYDDKFVLLDIYLVSEFEGQPSGLEGQLVKWQAIDALQQSDFPAANAGIIKTIQLPTELAITPEAGSFDELLELVQNLQKQSIRIIQLRQKHLGIKQYARWSEELISYLADSEVLLMFNQPLAEYRANGNGGYHCSSEVLHALDSRPAVASLVSASCHGLADLQKAEQLQLDFALLSPVAKTDKYEDEAILGWQQFAFLANQVSIPVFALGGMSRSDQPIARHFGAYGIAGISTFSYH